MAKSARTTAPAPPPDPPADDPPGVEEADLLAASVARVEHRLRLLDELAEMTMKLARGVAEQGLAAKASRADAPAAEAPPPDTADEFAKLSHAVRLTFDLEARTDGALRAGKPAAGERNIPQVRNYPRVPGGNR